MVVQENDDGHKEYLRLIKEYYKINKITSAIHIDYLVLIYRISSGEKAFDLLFKCHRGLLIGLVRFVFNKYKRYLYSEDYEELLLMANMEFFRRVMYYKIPPEAPFSAYVKLYMKKWLNAYAKLMVNSNNKSILQVDYKTNKQKGENN